MGEKPSVFPNIKCSEFPSFSICTILAQATITSCWDQGNILLTHSFSASALLTLGAASLFVGGEGCPVQCGMLSSIPDLYLLDASSTLPLPSCDNKKCLQTLPNSP